MKYAFSPSIQSASKEPVSIRVVNVDMKPEQHFAELCLDGVM